MSASVARAGQAEKRVMVRAPGAPDDVPFDDDFVQQGVSPCRWCGKQKNTPAWTQSGLGRRASRVSVFYELKAASQYFGGKPARFSGQVLKTRAGPIRFPTPPACLAGIGFHPGFGT